jgi:hypothetical protein
MKNEMQQKPGKLYENRLSFRDLNLHSKYEANTAKDSVDDNSKQKTA